VAEYLVDFCYTPAACESRWLFMNHIPGKQECLLRLGNTGEIQDD